ncbi:MAG: hypothetical protein A2X86_20565 [Bdellovibrionales bacterium GWA2_49_15]|nr:MAG: hypothetical protein A2X86_20565 [Bdellovibrionales bacterium GWA2_49_15]HAZ11291.1 sodium:proton antiporter [Bdellovibrionales bacterium]
MSMAPGLESVKHVIAIASGKGGVGKSTVTTNIALALHKLGYKVGLLDADLYGPSQPGLLGSTERPMGQDGYILPMTKGGIKFISMGAMNPSGKAFVVRAPIAVQAIQQFLTKVLWGDLDFLLVDLPPGTGDIQLTLVQMARFSGAVIVTTPQRVAAEIAKKAPDMFKSVNVPILGIVENMSGFTCTHCGEVSAPFKRGGGEAMAHELNVPFLGALPLDPEIMMSGDDGINLMETKPNSHAALAFVALAQKMAESLKVADSLGLTLEAERIETNGVAISVLWKDGSKSEVDAYSLRLQCPCAACVDEYTGTKILKVDSVPLTIRVEHFNLVGRYGLSVRFSDGHGTGIYKLSSVKEMLKKSAEATLSV